MRKVIGGLVYDTDTAERIADNWYRGNGADRLNTGRGTSLYRTGKGRFFVLHETCWQGEHDRVEVLDEEQAKAMFEQLSGDPEVYAEIFGEPQAA